MTEEIKDLGQKIKDVAIDLGKKAGDTIEVQKLKHNLRSLNGMQERDFAEIGRQVYAKFQINEIVDDDYISLCEIIEKREEEIITLEGEIQRVKTEGK